MNSWVGFSVSISCVDPLGCYQGTILEADGVTITLTKAFRNGFPYPKSHVTLKAEDIKDVKIIEAKTENNEKIHSVVSKSTQKKAHRSTVSENLQNNTNHYSNGHFQGRNQDQGKPNSSNYGVKNAIPSSNGQVSLNAKSKPIDIQNKQNKNGNGFHSYSGGVLFGVTPNKKEKQRKKNEACFGTPSDDPIMNQEFDFEKNLALFDKKGLWEELNQAQKPDVIQHTEHSRRPARFSNYMPVAPTQQPKFRHDENVLTSAPAIYRAIVLPDIGRGPKEYVSDEGLIVPTINPQFRKQLWQACGRAGLAGGAAELLARAACDTALRLMGGDRRLDPTNAHQAPTAVVLAGAHWAGVAGVACARHLASHGVNTVLLVAGPDMQGSLRPHLDLYRLTGNKLTTEIADLTTADIIIVALQEHGEDPPGSQELAEWARQSRAPVLALDPPAAGTHGFATKYSLLPILPLSHGPENGKLYLCNLAIPGKIFSELGVKYRSPFGAKTVIAIHPKEEH